MNNKGSISLEVMPFYRAIYIFFACCEKLLCKEQMFGIIELILRPKSILV